MKAAFTSDAWDDMLYWAANDRAKLARVIRVVDDILLHPFAGIGKPEPLKYDLAGAWSRRIDDEHRLVYVVEADTVSIIAARFHYHE